MPRPTAAQLAYGSATVIVSTLAMLLLSGRVGHRRPVIAAVTALALGLLVALTVPRPGSPPRPRTRPRTRDASRVRRP